LLLPCCYCFDFPFFFCQHLLFCCHLLPSTILDELCPIKNFGVVVLSCSWILRAASIKDDPDMPWLPKVRFNQQQSYPNVWGRGSYVILCITFFPFLHEFHWNSGG
jgi:hypothetical protein